MITTDKKVYSCPCGCTDLIPVNCNVRNKILYKCTKCEYTNSLGFMILHPISWMDAKPEDSDSKSKMPVKEWAIYQLLCGISAQPTTSTDTTRKYREIAHILWEARITNKTVRDMAAALGVKVYKTEPKKKG